MSKTAAPDPTAPGFEAVQERVLESVRELARELGGSRAARATSPEVSLERELGLGSLERVELLLRLESAFGRPLGDDCLQIDTPAGLARAILEPRFDLGGPAAGRAELVGASRVTDASEVTAPPAPLPTPAATLHEGFWRRAQAEPNRVHVYLREDDGREHVVRYGALLADALAVAGGLFELGVREGDRVALMLPTGLDFLRAFQGVLMARAVAVPIYPPVRLDRLEEYARRQAAILANAEARVLITIDRARPVAALLRSSVPSLVALTTAPELVARGASWEAPLGAASDPALIQYTSGSTGQPKGVLLTHANLLANIRAIATALEARPTDVGASWLPLYHDMGLIGSWLFCQHQGIPIDIQSPLAFLSRPERWLWTIHRRRATLSAAPNFAYELCVRRIPDQALEGLDLSSWRCAMNGAEPVQPDTVERFIKRFERYGFRPEAMMPVYGLAENSVALCVPPPGRGPRVVRAARAPFESAGQVEPAPAEDSTALRFVSEGRVLPEHEVRVVSGDEGALELPERRVGRIVFRGPSMTAGYFRQPEATAAITLPGGWLDSGDLGFVEGGELFVTGRRKDLIIKGGRNLVPQEIEEVAASVDGIRKGCVAAFGVEHATLGTESLVVVAETRATESAARDRLVAEVTERVAAAVGVPPDVVALVPPGAVPKTSSGKIRRADTRRLYVSGTLGAAGGLAWRTRVRLLAALAAGELRRRTGDLAAAAYTAYVSLAVLSFFLLLWPAAMVLPRKRSQALVRRAARGLLRVAGFRFSVDGLERLAGPGPYVLAVNHSSYVDVPALLALLPLDALFVAKKEVASWPMVGAFFRKVGHLPVDRGDSQQSVSTAGRVARALEDGHSVLFFPEGTFTAAAGVRPLRLGAFKSAIETGTPVVPLALRGTRRALRAGEWRLRPSRIRLWIGAPIPSEGDGWRAVVALRDRVAAEIAAHCGEPLLDMGAAAPVPP